MLTSRQKILLEFIDTQTAANGGVCPSYDDMRRHMGLKSKSGIHRLVTALEARGFIRRLPRCARAIEVIRRPISARAPRGPLSAAKAITPDLPRAA